ncbi:MAG: 16S rRNA (adenine(1518)-N(6)/adenine(1519)-N(6))-dimethyltransferase RsmA [Paludibacteraceae bacterium]|nr:16S rRNA (adenine(1518)-N(6)/adenine(1519)-N(6))-dimethyltransferase RsmA [Paludibacteraceae bacterium]
MQRVHAKKFLGQHFLKDLNVAQRIAETITSITPITPPQPSPQGEGGSDPIRVLEIGPGMGVLTQFLLKDPNIQLTAIEIDRESVAYLKEWYPELHLIEGDFLKLDLNILYPEGEFNVIGNYPYNISSQIFFKVLEYKDRIPVCSGMIQKEVAERIASKPGKKAYGILSVLLQAYYDIEYLFTVDEYVFNPPPKVKSAVIRMTRNKRRRLECDEELFKTVVKTAFNQRRKQMRNSLKGLVNPTQEEFYDRPQDARSSRALHPSREGEENERLEYFLTRRPEQLSVEEFIELTNLIEKSHVRNQDIL